MSHPLDIPDAEWPDSVAAAGLVRLLHVALRRRLIVVKHDPEHGVNIELNHDLADEIIRRGRERRIFPVALTIGGMP